MKIVIFLYTFPLILLSGNIEFNGKPVYIQTESIGKNEYMNSDILVNTFKLFIENTDNELILEKGLIRYSPGSFFLVYENKNELLVYQMPSPVISFKNSEYIPITGFFLALNHFNILNVNIENNKIIVQSIEEYKSEIKNKLNLKSLDKSIQNSQPARNLSNNTNDEVINFETDFSATFYELSLKIIRNIRYYNLPDTNGFKRLDYPPDIYLLPESLKKK